MVPFERNMVALKKKIVYQKKNGDTRMKWRHHEEHCLAVAQCENVKSAMIGAEARTQSTFCALNAIKAYVFALRVNFVSLLCSNGTFCAFVLRSSLPATVQSEEVIHNNVITGCLIKLACYIQRSNKPLDWI